MQNHVRLEKSRPKTRFVDVKKSLRSIVFAAIISLLLAASCDTAGEGPPPPPGFASEVVALINDARSEGNTCQNSQGDVTEYAATHPLTEDDRLEQAARKHSRDMAENNFFDHESETDGSRARDRIVAAGYQLSGASGVNEVLARGSDARAPRIAVDAWLVSKNGHCDAIMNPRYSEVGAGVVKNQGEFPPYLTVVFVTPQP